MFHIEISPLTRELLALADSGAPEHVAMISIMDHQRDARVPYPSARVLRLCFDDATESSFWQNLMTAGQATMIRDFILQHMDEIELLIVHCTEGVSRSAAVAAGILDGLGENASWIWSDPHYRPNQLVYSLVLNAFVT